MKEPNEPVNDETGASEKAKPKKTIVVPQKEPLPTWANTAGGLALLGLLVFLGVYVSLIVLVVVLGVVLMLVLHELGHFATAKLTGMKASEFFIGFGPRIWSFKKGETEYGARILPLGAYVRIAGMSNLEEIPAAEEQRTYRSKPYRSRLLVAVAGSAMHFILAIVVLWVMFTAIGYYPIDQRLDPDEEYASWRVIRVIEDSPAEQAGLQSDDRIVAAQVSGSERISLANYKTTLAFVRQHPNENVTFFVDRDGREVPLDATLEARDVSVREPLPGSAEWQITGVAEGSQAERAGFRPGDRVVAAQVSGLERVTLASYGETVDFIRQHSDQEVMFFVDRGGQEVPLTPTVGVADVRVREPLPNSAGWQITRVVEGSQAERAGFQLGDRIVAAQVSGSERVTLASYGETVDFIRQHSDQEVSFFVDRGGDQEVLLTPTMGVEVPLSESTEPPVLIGRLGFQWGPPTAGILEGFVGAVVEFGQLTKHSFQAVPRVFSPSGLADLFGQVFGGEGEDDARLLSLYGVGRLATELGDVGEWDSLLSLYVVVNIFIGFFNLLPLPPLDGGHVAVATYERLRSRGGRSYRIDAAKLIPVQYAVLSVLLVIGIAVLFLDVVDPIRLF